MKYFWDFNTNIKLRDEIIFGNYNPSYYGNHGGMTRRFKGLTLDKLNDLTALKFLSLDDRQNDSPSIGAIIDFMSTHEGFTAHGYAVSDQRCDYRVSIEGIEKRGDITEQDMHDFTEMFRYADDFTCTKNPLHCWFD